MRFYIIRDGYIKMSIYFFEGLSLCKYLWPIEKVHLAFTFSHLTLFTGYEILEIAADEPGCGEKNLSSS